MSLMNRIYFEMLLFKDLKTLSPKKSKVKQKWMTDEIIEMMNQRRVAKKENTKN